MIPTTVNSLGFLPKAKAVTKTLSKQRLFSHTRFSCVIPADGPTRTHYRQDSDEQPGGQSQRFGLFTGLSVGFVSAFLGFSKYKETSKEHRREKTDDTESGKRIITLAEVNKHKSAKDGGIWVVFKGKVYDVTEFVDIHPGGDKILLAAGSDVAPYWSLYAFHHEKHVLDILKDYYIGDLPESEVALSAQEERSSAYANDPVRHPALITISKEPRNAETPTVLIPDHPITPNELFFVRNHLPVPDIDAKKHRLQISSPVLLDVHGKPVDISLSLDDLKRNYPIRSFVSTVICAGNRRSRMAKEDVEKARAEKRKPYIRGLDWQHGAVSTAEWRGVRLVDVLAKHLLPPNAQNNYFAIMEAVQKAKIRHIQFEGADYDHVVGGAYGASMPIEWALDPQMDVLIAFEMNGQPIPRDHGAPLRVIVPGSIGARQVKWLTKITLASDESPSYYQREDYKVGYICGDEEHPNFAHVPAIYDYPIQSAICHPADGQTLTHDGSITVRGYALSGAGRGVLSVRVSGDNGKTWHEAKLQPVSLPAGIDPEDLPKGDLALAHRTRYQWAWTLWEAKLPIPADAKEIEISCCARDSSNAVQPQSCDASVNVRGLMANSWHRVRVFFSKPD